MKNIIKILIVIGCLVPSVNSFSAARTASRCATIAKSYVGARYMSTSRRSVLDSLKKNIYKGLRRRSLEIEGSVQANLKDVCAVAAGLEPKSILSDDSSTALQVTQRIIKECQLPASDYFYGYREMPSELGLEKLNKEEECKAKKVLKRVGDFSDTQVLMYKGEPDGTGFTASAGLKLLPEAVSFIIYRNFSPIEDCVVMRNIGQTYFNHEGVHIKNNDIFSNQFLIIKENLDQVLGLMKDHGVQVLNSCILQTMFDCKKGLKKGFVGQKHLSFCERRADLVSALESRNPIFSLVVYLCTPNMGEIYMHREEFDELLYDLLLAGVKDPDYHEIVSKIEKDYLHSYGNILDLYKKYHGE